MLGIDAAAGGAGAETAALKAKSKTVTVGVMPRVGGVAATCEGGRQPVSGGFESRGSSPTGATGVQPWSSQAKGKRRWRVTGSAWTVRAPLTAFAYCRRGGAPITMRKNSKRIGVNQVRTVTKSCKPGERVLSGGFATRPVKAGPAGLPAGRALVIESRRVGERNWRVKGLYPGGPVAAVRLIVRVYCERSGRSLSEASRTTQVGSDDVGQVTARCKGRRKAVSGGFAGASPTVAGPFVLPHTSRRRAGAAWMAGAWNLGDPGALTAYAYCAKRL